jgi:adenylylsulfate kinase-like enzyme
LYAKARRGEIKAFTGIDGPYEAPTNPDLELETCIRTAEENAGVVLEELRSRGFVKDSQAP